MNLMVKIAMRSIKSQDIKDAVTLRNKIISDRSFGEIAQCRL